MAQQQLICAQHMPMPLAWRICRIHVAYLPDTGLNVCLVQSKKYAGSFAIRLATAEACATCTL